jgi:hypothetical protein
LGVVPFSVILPIGRIERGPHILQYGGVSPNRRKFRQPSRSPIR